ncbi:unnamed protein product [Scytosiphon promiscuus]
MRQFEQSSAENTKRALLQNDGQLCEPPSWSSRRQLGVLHPGGGGGKPESKGGGHEPSLSSSPPLPASLRYVPGDPFANEEADVEAWAEHFTYLSVVPAGEGQGGPGRKYGGCDVDGGDSGDGGDFSENGPTSKNRPDAERLFRAVGPPDVMETEEEEPEAGGGGKAAKRGIQEGGARAQRVPLVAAAPEAAGNGQGEQRRWLRPQEDEEEEVFASHGVYEEYLAYDCRPPEDYSSYTHKDPLGPSGVGVLGAGDSGQTGQGGAEGSCVDAVEQRARTVEARGQPPATAATGTEGMPGLDTPRRELRQEIMDRLFDELWARLTPDLVSLLDQEPQQPRVAPDASRDMESEKMEEEVGAGFRLSAP